MISVKRKIDSVLVDFKFPVGELQSKENQLKKKTSGGVERTSSLITILAK